MRRWAGLLLTCSLSACTPQLSLLGTLGGNTSAKGSPVAVQAAPVCPGSLMAEPLPEPPLPPGAGFPAPTTPEASASVTQYLTWLHQEAIWGRQGWAIVKTAHSFCLTSFLH